MEEYLNKNLSNKWIEKNKPNSINDLIGNTNQVSIFKNWLLNFYKVDDNKKNFKTLNKTIENYSSCIVNGSHGIGKTSFVTTILTSLKYKIFIINFNKINNSKNIKEIVNKILSGVSIFNVISGKKTEKIAIFIDDLDSIISPIEKKFIEIMLKENDIIKKYPIILISSNKHSKFINQLKSTCYNLSIPLPNINVMMELLTKICYNNSMILSSEETAKKIIEHSQNDFRRLICTLEDLYSNYKSNEITDEKLSNYFDFSKKKDIDVDIYKSTANLFFDNKLNIQNRLISYETERTILPLMVQQNAIKCVNESNYNKNIFDELEKITTSLSKGDVIENYIYCDQNWSLQETHGFYTCVNPSYYISKLCGNSEYQKKNFVMDFPLDLNRTSIKHINVKNVKTAIKEFPNMEISDFINSKNLIKHLLLNNNITEYKNLIKNYNVTAIGIQSVIKVDKIIDTKTNIPAALIKKITNNT